MPIYQTHFTNEEIRQIWQAEVLPRRFKQALTSPSPELLLVGGQSGSGKTSALNLLVKDHVSGIVSVNGDDFRQFHPDYAALLANDPLLMPQVTAGLSGQLVEYSLAYGFTNGYSLAVEGTWRDPQVAIRTAGMAKQNGHKVRAVCLAVPETLSRVATATRYYFDVGQGHPARWTPPGVHDQVVAGGPRVAGMSPSPETPNYATARGPRVAGMSQALGTMYYPISSGPRVAGRHVPARSATPFLA